MTDSITAATLTRWRSGMPDPRERLYRLLLEHITPVHLQRLLGSESLPRSPRSPAWFMWRVISEVHLPEQLPVLIEVLPTQADALTEISAAWSDRWARGAVLLEFSQPDGRISVSALEHLLEALRDELGDVSLSGIFFGTPHLRPQTTMVLELSMSEPVMVRLVGDDELLESIEPGGCPLHSLHTVHERVWIRQPPSLPTIPRAVSIGAMVTGIVLAVVLVLIAVPNFFAMSYRAKRAEVPPNVDGIKTAELAYDAAFDRFVEQREFVPSAEVGKAQRPWREGTAFDTLGWAPDGQVRGAYRVTTHGCGGTEVDCGRPDFNVTGIIDIDGDGEQATYTATRSMNTTMMTEDAW
jgi:hypothetical protein